MQDFENDIINDVGVRSKIVEEEDLKYLREDVKCYMKEHNLERFAGISKDDWNNLDYNDLEYVLSDIAEKRDEIRMDDMSIDDCLKFYE